MEQKSDRLYPTAPLEKDINLEQRLEKKLNDVNSFLTTSTTLTK